VTLQKLYTGFTDVPASGALIASDISLSLFLSYKETVSGLVKLASFDINGWSSSSNVLSSRNLLTFSNVERSYSMNLYTLNNEEFLLFSG